MTAQPETLFRRYPGYLGPIPAWYSPASPVTTVDTLRLLDDVPRCDRCKTAADRRACRGLALKRDGLDWKRVAREVGYPSASKAKRAVVAHLRREVESSHTS